MTDSRSIAESLILDPASLGETQLQSVLSGMLGPSIDAADLYFQVRQREAWQLEDGIVKEGSRDIERGVGVRAISGEKTGLAYSDEIEFQALLEASRSARAIAAGGKPGRLQAWQRKNAPALYSAIDPLAGIDDTSKVQLLAEVDAAARRMDPRVKQVFVTLTGSHDVVLIAASDGTWATDVRPLVRLSVSVIAESNGRREQGSAGGGGRYSYENLLQPGVARSYAEEAVRQALVNLEAGPAPAGTMPVVLASGWPGILLHEAVGHGLEGDFNRKQTSAFSGRIGQQVASTQCTVVDDGTLPQRRGSLNIDDEGTPTEKTVLIENGILRGYMQDKLNAGLMGMRSTGNGRRESYAHLPMPRMTNTYMLPGKYSPEEIIASVDKGLYAVNFAGGQVDITNGKFVFSASEAYLIEKGKVTRPVKGATLIGSGPETMTRISMVGNDLQLDSGIGVCGKDGQSVPVGVGQPTLKIDSITVGGTQA
ncbi:MAG TPA: metalloprotease TldD [Gammaproteobacteria bacterium]|nr:metalloprotease TldD [Gammaproteobacteria bacterium]